MILIIVLAAAALMVAVLIDRLEQQMEWKQTRRRLEGARRDHPAAGIRTGRWPYDVESDPKWRDA